MKVIALGVGLTQQISLDEWSRVKKAPKPLTEFKPKRFEDDYKKGE